MLRFSGVLQLPIILDKRVSRRALLVGGAASLITAKLGSAAWSEETGSEKLFRLGASPDSVSLVNDPSRRTDVWCYNGTVPGPTIRVRQGDLIRVIVENELEEDTTVHWHGMRVPNAMDGVPHLTQKPISPRKSFVYAFKAVDAGTFWYHPHQRGFEQVGRGLYGPLIVEERGPVPVDRDIIWVLDDWRLLPSSQIAGGFGGMHDVSHAGRIGNTVTINGQVPDKLLVRRGERIRLRLINAANARIFRLNFNGHDPKVIALDGQPVASHSPGNNQIVLGPAMRIDLIIDMTGTASREYSVTDNFYRGLEYRLVDLAYQSQPSRHLQQLPLPELPANPLTEPDIASATRFEIKFSGGMMGGMSGAMMGGRRRDARSLMHNGKVWAVNGVAASGHILDPVVTLPLGSSCILNLHNDTAWYHPIHLHGHSFRVLRRNGLPTALHEWQDTVLMVPREKVEVAFVADNPGDWMFHCHILEHQAAGMMAVIRVA